MKEAVLTVPSNVETPQTFIEAAKSCGLIEGDGEFLWPTQLVNSKGANVIDNKAKEAKKREHRETLNAAARVIEYLNHCAERRFSTDKTANVNRIIALFNQGFTEGDMTTVIERKTKEWKGTDFDKFLRPTTLFGEKFEAYLNEDDSASGKKSRQQEVAQTMNLAGGLLNMMDEGGDDE